VAVNERFDFTGRSVLITGGGKGLGKVYAEEFAKAGAHVTSKPQKPSRRRCTDRA